MRWIEKNTPTISLGGGEPPVAFAEAEAESGTAVVVFERGTVKARHDGVNYDLRVPYDGERMAVVLDSSEAAFAVSQVFGRLAVFLRENGR